MNILDMDLLINKILYMDHGYFFREGDFEQWAEIILKSVSL